MRFTSVVFPAPVGPTLVHYPGNNGVYSQAVPVFLCPSDPSAPGGVLTIDGFSFGASSYAVNALASSRDPLTSAPIDVPQGKARIPDDFPDGTSNTILHAEKYARCSISALPPILGDGGNAWAYCTTLLFPFLPEPMNPPGRAYQTGFAIPALAMRGAPAKAIQELAGHQSLTMTLRYMHLSPSARDAAIRLLDEGRRGETLEKASAGGT